MTTSSERTYKLLKDLGLEWNITFGKVELPYTKFTKRRLDFLNIIDVIVCYNGIIGLQICSKDWQPHVEKILKSESSIHWLNQGGRLVLIGWRQLLVKRGGKAKKWTPRIAEFYIKDGKIGIIDRAEFG
jgi:hypothetical protein